MSGDSGLSLPAQGYERVSQLRRVLLNALFLLGAYALPRAFTVAAAVVAARVLGVATFGAYGSAAALAVILSIVATLGMMQLLVREVARTPRRAPELLGAAHVAKAGSVVVMMAALLALAAGPLDYGREMLQASLLLGLAYAIGAYAENLGAYFQGIERMGAWLQAQALYGLVFGVLGIVLVLTTRDLVWFCAAPVAGQLVAVGWLVLRSPPSIRRAWRAPWPLVAQLLRSLAPFAAAFIVLTAYRKVDILILEQWRGTLEAGIYAAAYKFVDLAQALALVIATALYPRLSRLAADRPAARGRGERWAAGRAAELLLLAGVPAAGLLWLLRDPFVTLLFGEAYDASTPALGLLAPALPMLALNALGTVILAAAGRMRAVAVLYLCALVLNVGLNTMLIPAYGATGAALATLVSEVTLGAAMLVALRRFAAAAPRSRAVVPAVAAGALAVVLELAGVGGVVTTGAVYLGIVVVAYVAAGVLTPEERSLLRRALGG